MDYDAESASESIQFRVHTELLKLVFRDFP